ncbi:MAG: zinc-ribbon domain-containing protein [Desulfobulbaceae bacterium]|nr:zinc-ribbon domain-containing protein [Desulfobulbaceae bacterium]
MLVICEDCSKKYNIDENRIKGTKAKFSCRECGHIIVVDKPEPEALPPQQEPLPEPEVNVPEQEAAEKVQEKKSPTASVVAAAKGKGIPIGVYLLLTLIGGFVAISGAFSYLYLTNIPDVIHQQIELRTQAITASFSGVITKPLLLRNYLQVNKEAQRTSKLPGVAYAAVFNKKGIVIAGFFSDLERFDKQFSAQVKEKGFPADVIAQNKLTTGAVQASTRIMVGGQSIVDQVMHDPETNSQVHVGIYVADVDKAINNVLFSPLTYALVGGALLMGLIAFIILNKTITRPMQDLTNVANRISLGEMGLSVSPDGPREMRELAIALERMRYSIKMAMDRLKK